MCKKSRFLRPGRIVLFILGCIGLCYSIIFNSFSLDKKITIESGDTIESFTRELSLFSRLRVRWYVRQHSNELKSLQLGSYVFSGSYTPDTFVRSINSGPTRSFVKIRILEGWSIYDIDEYLFAQGYSSPGDYIRYVSDVAIIESLSQKFDFVKKFIDTKPKESGSFTLEGLLYGDTYHLSNNQPIIPQLVSMQLETFGDKVFNPLSRLIDGFSSSMSSQGFGFSLGFYNMITLSSIVEKEERMNKNKALIAGIFMNRIQQSMRIDADITLCYGLKQGYKVCTPRVIVASIDDENNIYNTRKRKGLTPTPIANPSVDTIKSVLQFQKNINLYYLHDADGNIWTAETVEGHNENKRKYL